MQGKELVRYIYNVVNGLKRQGINVSDNQVQLLINKYSNSNMSSEQIVADIDRVVSEFVAKKSEQDELVREASNRKTLQNLDIAYNGITLNNQDIDLMMIACSNTPEELQRALDIITNIKLTLDVTDMSEDEFIAARENAYNAYLDGLSSRNEWIRHPEIRESGKIKYLINSGILSVDELKVLKDVLDGTGTASEKFKKIIEAMPTRIHEISKVIRDFEPIEKEGITSMTIEKSRELYEQIMNNYNSITIDEEMKYGNIVLADGTFDFEHLSKSLDFCREIGKEVRLNTLMFYMDFPNNLKGLPVNEESRQLVKNRLMDYVDSTTRFIGENYSDIVRSIDVFNELLNRHPLSGSVVDNDRYIELMESFGLDPKGDYYLRSELPQIESLYSNFDNVDAGWMRYLSLEDICDVISVARRNLPDVDFMYNDDHLVDDAKLGPTSSLLKKIQAYEATHGVKLIDSIGTQMHIDNNVSNESIRRMLLELSRFGLPIEVTEFDLAMTSDVEGLSDDVIQAMRLKKIDDIHGIVDELGDRCGIRGFTIWSKTDSQNFRVHIENEQRIRNGEEPITTLHGGFFSEDMSVKNKKFRSKQNFNYHTHTRRCGHAGIDTDRAYVMAAREAGITRLGFSDHGPLCYFEYADLLNKMDVSEVDGYIDSINGLKEEFPDMEILCGFEAEYDPMKKDYLYSLRSKVDYMILGQHFVKNGLSLVGGDRNPNYPIEYAKSVCEAMETGLFDIVAHPDLFMKYRDSISDDSRELYDANVEQAIRMICKTAADLEIPLELNLTCVNENMIMKDGEYSYPHSKFWEIASEYDVQVVYAADSHNPQQLINMEENIGLLQRRIDTSKLTFVGDDYSLVVARENNLKLAGLLENTRSDSMTYESNLVYALVNASVSRLGEDCNVGQVLIDGLRDTQDRLSTETAPFEARIEGKKVEISNDDRFSPDVKNYYISRLNMESKLLGQVRAKRDAIFDRAVESTISAVELGCTSPSDFTQVVTDLTEVRSQSDIGKASEASERIMSFQETKVNSNSQERGKTLVYTNNSSNAGNSGNNSEGYTNSLFLVIAIAILSILSIIILNIFI